MSKIKKYIEDAVNAAVSEVTTKGVEVKDCNFDSDVNVNVDNGDLTSVLQTLAEAQIAIADAVIKVSKSKPDIVNNSTGLSFQGLSSKPFEFNLDEGNEDE